MNNDVILYDEKEYNVIKSYNGNPLIKSAYQDIEWTPELVKEYIKCSTDIIYFTEKYMKIITNDEGLTSFTLFPYQRQMLRNFTNERFSIVNASRRAGKSIIACAFILHYIIFNDAKTIMLLANKGKLAMETLSKVQLAYENLPKWIQQGVLTFNKGEILLENKSRVIASAGSVRGFDVNCLYVDECVVGDTIVTINHKITGIIEDISIKELHNRLNHNEIFSNYIKNSDYEILTLEGFKPFNGVNLSHKKTIKIIFEDNTHIECTYDHKLRVFDRYIEAKDIIIGDNLTNKIVKDIIYNEEIKEVFDAIGVRDTQSYFTNGIISKNCAFIENWDEFYKGAYPTISSGKDSKIILTSTPNSMNHFYSLWSLALEGKNGYKPLKVTWEDVPTLATEEWRLNALANLNGDMEKFTQEYCVEGNTLITVRNKITGIIEEVKIKDLSKILKPLNEISFVNKNEDYEVLTPDGWSNFDGIISTLKMGKVEITTENNFLSCTIGHKLLNEKNDFINAELIKINDRILTKTGKEIVTKIEIDFEYIDFFYDVKDVELKNQYYTNNLISHNCAEFLGSSNSLISGRKLQELFPKTPIAQKDGFYQYETPKPNHVYTIVCDVGAGKGGDYSAFQVIDVTVMPYIQVAAYRNNTITPADYAEIIFRTGKNYNLAMVLVELNNMGGQVTHVLQYELGYENLLCSTNKGGVKSITSGFGSSSLIDKGIMTTKLVKSVGCSMLKMLIEQNQLLIYDEHTIRELTTFSKNKNSYEAESGKHDDLVVGLFLFAWLTDQQYFKDSTNINTPLLLRQITDEQMDEEMLPFGFRVDGREEFVNDDYYSDKRVNEYDNYAWMDELQFF